MFDYKAAALRDSKHFKHTILRNRLLRRAKDRDEVTGEDGYLEMHHLQYYKSEYAGHIAYAPAWDYPDENFLMLTPENHSLITDNIGHIKHIRHGFSLVLPELKDYIVNKVIELRFSVNRKLRPPNIEELEYILRLDRKYHEAFCKHNGIAFKELTNS